MNDFKQPSGQDAQIAPTFAVKVRSYEVFDAPGLGQAVHNEIIFEQDGKTLFSFNGNPWKRETGQPNFPGYGDNNTLRVNAQAGKTIADNDVDGKFPVVSEQTLYAGNDTGKFFELLGRATEASSFINSQNLDYIMVDPLRVAQNSNSVSDTLTKAMGLQYPAETENLWAPGHGRVLLPQDFQSIFSGVSNNPDWMEKPGAGPYVTSVINGLEKLNDQNVSLQILKDPKHPNAAPPEDDYSSSKPNNVPTFFNPKNFVVPASFLGQDIPLQQPDKRPEYHPAS